MVSYELGGLLTTYAPNANPDPITASRIMLMLPCGGGGGINGGSLLSVANCRAYRKS